uniref:Acyltransferase 1 n=1 Tax=Boswellia serrata TaxID=613112 RepID=A0A8F5M6F3_BOSSE|nr:acyltransferase 1 [Boswellia serrata]
MEVRTISTEIIKPSSPTPSHLRVHKLSVLDQLTPDIYFSILLFYSGLAWKRTTKALQLSDHLKKSLSETLTHYYPFAGRVNDDDKSVNCDDSGAIFIEAQVTNKMSEILKQPQMDTLAQLCPRNVSNNTLTSQPNLAVQVNYFYCGGVAIAVCFRHVVADASAVANFIKNWAAIARGVSDHHITKNDIVFDCSSIFPPQELSGLLKSLFEKHCSTKEIVRKRFTFDVAKIAALRDKINEGSCNLDGPTRFEAVSTLILSAVIAAVKERDQSSTCPKYLAAFIPVNLRKRMNPPFPEQCIGNIYQATQITWPIEKTMSDYKCLAAKLKESIKMINDNYVRKLHEGGGYADLLRKEDNSINLIGTEVQSFAVSGWCRFPFYEADFGWGKPMWVSTTFRVDNNAILLDACDGQGIEAWVGLSKEDMEKFEQDPGIMTYASLNPSI